jgi:hypothetical protein
MFSFRSLSPGNADVRSSRQFGHHSWRQIVKIRLGNYSDPVPLELTGTYSATGQVIVSPAAKRSVISFGTFMNWPRSDFAGMSRLSFGANSKYRSTNAL